jgi:tRNA (cytidine/uridine-2'-O-)-methyltransferase
MNVVLVEPEIPPNTGNVARLCAATRTTLHLIEPFGFKLDDAQLKRAGLDYWQHLNWHRWPNWAAFQKQLPANARLWIIESKGTKRYDQIIFGANDYLVFGRETAGLPKQLLDQHKDSWVRIPMFHDKVRRYDQITFGANDYLVFGRETAGLPKQLLDQHKDSWVRIPMFHDKVRSLNLSNCVALVLYEALRQQGFAAEVE